MNTISYEKIKYIYIKLLTCYYIITCNDNNDKFVRILSCYYLLLYEKHFENKKNQ